MTDPVFVIHGVANRDRDEFAAAVSALAAGAGVDMVPVHWGDLGAQDQYIDAVLPSPRADTNTLRGGEAPRPGPAEPFTAAAVAAGPVPEEQQLAEIDAAVRTCLEAEAEDGPDGGLRDADRLRLDPEEILAHVREAWADTEWLRHTGDEELLWETGRALARSLLDEADFDSDTEVGLRGGGGPGDGRLRALVRRRLTDLDRVAGAAVQAVGARLNHALRSRFGPGTTRFLGDVLVYQRRQEAIHARVRQVIDEVSPDLGRGPDRPVRVVAHSLGGVIAVDMATSAEPLWTDSLVTFGSQAAFFHVCDPRGGQLAPYAGGPPVRLPASLNRWTNLWEPLDVLAFAASKVFRLHDGTAPVDLPVDHPASIGVWTHSAYWRLPSVASVIGEVMCRPARGD